MMIGFFPTTYNSLGDLRFCGSHFGVSYYTYTDYEDDNVKIFHYVLSNSTKTLYIVQHTPYNFLTQDDLFTLANSISQVEEYDAINNCESEFDRV
jgi:hypothetical protein